MKSDKIGEIGTFLAKVQGIVETARLVLNETEQRLYKIQQSARRGLASDKEKDLEFRAIDYHASAALELLKKLHGG